MPSPPLYDIDVFTQAPYQGNPASVLVGSTAFDERQMQMIAREIGLPGNGFVWPAPVERRSRSCMALWRYFSEGTNPNGSPGCFT
jgi:PhzF family phenazine biosynthesis protein